MYPLHDLFPHRDSGVARIADSRVALIADPYRRDIVGRVADEIPGIVVAGGPGLSGDVHAVKLRGRARARLHHAFKHTRHQVSGGLLHGKFAAERLFNDGQPLGIHHPQVSARTVIDSVIGDSAVTGRHFNRAQAVGQAAHAQRREGLIVFVQSKIEFLRGKLVGFLHAQ